jgi:hypothetical protein
MKHLLLTTIAAATDGANVHALYEVGEEAQG